MLEEYPIVRGPDNGFIYPMYTSEPKFVLKRLYAIRGNRTTPLVIGIPRVCGVVWGKSIPSDEDQGLGKGRSAAAEATKRRELVDLESLESSCPNSMSRWSFPLLHAGGPVQSGPMSGPWVRRISENLSPLVRC